MMEPVYDRDDEEAYLARRERRRERWRREQLRRKKRKRLFCILALVLLGLFLILGILLATGKKSKAEKEALEIKQQELEEQQRLEAQQRQEAYAAEEEQLQSEEEIEEQTEKNYQFVRTEETTAISAPEVISSYALLAEVASGQITAEKGAFERVNPASMTKVLTVLVAAEALTEEDLEKTFTMTLEITDYSYVNDCSNVGFLDGEVILVKDLFYGTILPSGADAAVALATYVAGSQEAFVDRMNEKLAELGLADTAHFTNCVGLYDENHYCTLYDMAVIMRAAMENVLCREVLSAHVYTTAATSEHPEGITISNWFLRRIEDKDTGGEVLCAKTGYVVQSGNCAVSYGTFAEGKEYICVTAGSSSSWRCIYDQVEIYNRYVK